jgi:hypothetical protein
LSIGIANDEINAFNALREHVVNGITPTATDTDDFYDIRLILGQVK